MLVFDFVHAHSFVPTKIGEKKLTSNLNKRIDVTANSGKKRKTKSVTNVHVMYFSIRYAHFLSSSSSSLMFVPFFIVIVLFWILFL